MLKNTLSNITKIYLNRQRQHINFKLSHIRKKTNDLA